MLFNSLTFIIFFPLVCLVYWLLPSIRMRRGWLLVASYYFYMNWEPAYVLLMLFTTVSTWVGAKVIGRENREGKERIERGDVEEGKGWGGRKLVLAVTVFSNLFILFLYKYVDFFAENLTALLSLCGARMEIPEFRFLLPVGISFYTFQAIAYVADVYNRKEEPISSFWEYALFISFFPQLVAGPIERVRNMLPQFRTRQKFRYEDFETGLLMMVWGYFLKLCMADRCGIYVDAIFNNLPMHNGGSYLLASLLFPFQIYGDFCGYSMIAIGAARIMGYRMMHNFHNPYLALSISDFWTRWHISLSTFFRDYVYIPLGGSRRGMRLTCRNLMATMLVSGLWHGASWTFVIWGGFHGMWMCAERILHLTGKKESCTGGWRIVRVVLTFTLVTLGFIFFRADTLGDALTVVCGIVGNIAAPFKYWTVIGMSVLTISLVMLKDLAWEIGWNERLSLLGSLPKFAFVVAVISFILLFGVLDSNQFIYFQF